MHDELSRQLVRKIVHSRVRVVHMPVEKKEVLWLLSVRPTSKWLSVRHVTEAFTKGAFSPSCTFINMSWRNTGLPQEVLEHLDGSSVRSRLPRVLVFLFFFHCVTGGAADVG